MQIDRTSFDGLFVITPHKIGDARGYFMEIYKEEIFRQYIPNFHCIQENISRSIKNVFRGVHFQIPPYAQSKLVQCIEGEVVDFAVDLRIDSKTFLQCYEIVLSAENRKQVFIPKGFGHAFLVISDNATIMYKVDEIYQPYAERTINYLDPQIHLNITDYISDITQIILSDKDKNAPIGFNICKESNI